MVGYFGLNRQMAKNDRPSPSRAKSGETYDSRNGGLPKPQVNPREFTLVDSGLVKNNVAALLAETALVGESRSSTTPRLLRREDRRRLFRAGVIL
jgi:hypothetical protein